MPASGIYCEMFDSTGSNTVAATEGINWLADNGGGTLLAPTRRAIQDAFGLDSNKESKNFEGRFESKGITLRWPLRGGCALGAVFAFYCATNQLSTFAEQDGVEKVLFLPWSGQDKRWFEATLLVIKDPEVEDLPEEVDRVLRFLASAAAGYSTGLKWNEEERFKTELMAS
ncbi:hypothetical protein EII22_09650 [Coriobacteriales bacterium OH1046]|nr:hypothetical protein EII22_09650 [Coriobacteriales bacterium OH1046]